jgi:hypothetical protein
MPHAYEITADLLSEAMEAAARSFAPGELAYLALTSKLQHPIRDRLAWTLHTTLPDRVVAREWRRTDLAVLDASGTVPLALIEAKALYTFDVADPAGRQASHYPAQVAADLDKAHALSRSTGHQPAVFALVLVTHPMTQPPDLPSAVIKYLPHIRRSARHGTPAALRELAAAHLGPTLQRLGPVHPGRLDAGTAFATPTAVDYWIIGPTEDADTGTP